MNRALVVVLASVAFSSSGRRVSISHKDVPKEASAAQTVKDLSDLLLSFNPALTGSRPLTLPKQNHVGQRKTFDFQRAQAPLGRGGEISTKEVTAKASLACLASGMVNIIAFLEMGIPCTHHTGSATHVGRLLNTNTVFGDLTAGAAGMSIALLVLTYIMGAAVAGYAKCNGAALFEKKKSYGMFSAALVVVAGAVLRQMTGLVTPVLAIWSFSQGLQNAITTSAAGCVGFPVRTTHVTGAATDLGSQIGGWLDAKMAGKEFPLRKIIVFAASIFSFALGGYIARFLVPTYGAYTALLPALLMFLLGL